ncbi:hypothetical protein K466DRAFT_372502 [Polyporus arcularius HHB13444]|uniref:Uncharacterized protein n=1 Tax=Polyporus arcularius HHB13444 TaxID=1314778 RepID=A0A5C3PS59_9APHY|nr:hypothetical protein K466DRAFT_372502 [Polyporus arcularius HHB13444]
MIVRVLSIVPCVAPGMLTLLTATNTLLPFQSIYTCLWRLLLLQQAIWLLSGFLAQCLLPTSSTAFSHSAFEMRIRCITKSRHNLYQLVPVHYAWIAYRRSPLRAERPVQGFPCLVAAVRVPWDLRRSSMATSLPQQFKTSSQAVVPPGKENSMALVFIRRLLD